MMIPLGARAGTRTRMIAAVTYSGAAVVPPNVTWMPGALKFVPWILTSVPTGPLAGEKLPTVGGEVVASACAGNARVVRRPSAAARVRTRFRMAPNLGSAGP